MTSKDTNALNDAEYLDLIDPECEYDHEPDHDDMFDCDSALGSAGFGTDEYYDNYSDNFFNDY